MWLLSSLSLDTTSILLGGVVLLCLLWWLSTRRPPGIPPGPGRTLPFLGHIHLLESDPRAQYRAWRRQYGDVFSLYVGGRLMVVLGSCSAIREALVKFADVFSHRPRTFTSEQILQTNGLVFSSGPKWKEQRKTALGILREMGLGKNVLAEKIQEEITHYIQAILDHQGAPFDLGQLTQVSVSNNICSIIFGKRFQYQDNKFQSYLECANRNLKLLPSTGVLNFLPELTYLPGDLFHVKDIMANMRYIFSFVDCHLVDHKVTLDSNRIHHQVTPGQEKEKEDKKEEGNKEEKENEEEEERDKDFIYCYLRETEKRKAAGHVDTTLGEVNLRMSVSDLFLAGSETTSSALQWALLFFLYNPHVQEKCFKEISEVIGLHRYPTMQDKPNLMYVEATIWEVLRKGDIVPFSIPHASTEDVIFRGYVIPKDTILVPDLSSVLQDPDIWGDPENFRPERFIGPDGKLTRRDELIPFSIGRRACLGEPLARMELFLYLTTLIQRFRFLPAEEGKLPSLEGVFGLLHIPQPYNICAVPRM